MHFRHFANIAFFHRIILKIKNRYIDSLEGYASNTAICEINEGFKGIKRRTRKNKRKNIK